MVVPPVEVIHHHGPVILQGIVGSTAYGLAGAHSDIDRLGVFVWPTEKWWGLSTPPKTYTSPEGEPDITLHEVKKYIGLSMSGNPSLLELLFLPDELIEIETAEGRQLRGLREQILSTQAVRDAFGGYAVQQARKLRSRHAQGRKGWSSDINEKRIPKHGRHIFRLLLQGGELLSTGHITVNVGSARGEIFEMGALAASDPDAFHDRFERELHRLNTIDSVLADEPDRWALESYLITLRESWCP